MFSVPAVHSCKLLFFGNFCDWEVICVFASHLSILWPAVLIFFPQTWRKSYSVSWPLLHFAGQTQRLRGHKQPWRTSDRFLERRCWELGSSDISGSLHWKSKVLPSQPLLRMDWSRRLGNMSVSQRECLLWFVDRIRKDLARWGAGTPLSPREGRREPGALPTQLFQKTHSRVLEAPAPAPGSREPPFWKTVPFRRKARVTVMTFPGTKSKNATAATAACLALRTCPDSHRSQQSSLYHVEVKSL